jgi:type IV pilus assembly protein PilA
MKKIVANLCRSFRKGENGFTLIELLIVIAILGIIAAIVIPNAAGFMVSGRLNAANTEIANVKTAATGYMAEHGAFPADSSLIITYLSGTPKAVYVFDASGNITAIGAAGNFTDADWVGLTYDPAVAVQQWKRT